MVDDLRHEAPCGVDAVGSNKTVDFVEISVSRIGYDQVFRRDRSSPLARMSAFIASGPGDLRYSPRRYAVSAASIFARSRTRSLASAEGKFPLATCRAMIASTSSPGT